MYHIVYLSSVVEEMSEEALRDLLVHSRRRNQRLAITGLLLFSNGRILQVLEGQQQAVEAMFQTIRQDCRHAHVYKLSDGPIPQRTFLDWSMGFATASPTQFERLAGYQDPQSPEFMARRPLSMDQPFFQLLKEFAAPTATL